MRPWDVKFRPFSKETRNLETYKTTEIMGCKNAGPTTASSSVQKKGLVMRSLASLPGLFPSPSQSGRSGPDSDLVGEPGPFE